MEKRHGHRFPWNSRLLLRVGLLVVCTFVSTQALATELIYQPVNPNFGGNPLNGSYLLNSAVLQDPHGFLKEPEKATPVKTPIQQFNERLTNSVLSKLSDKIVASAFGEDSLAPGTYKIDSFDITVSSDLGGITVNINDTSTGKKTQVQVPYF